MSDSGRVVVKPSNSYVGRTLADLPNAALRAYQYGQRNRQYAEAQAAQAHMEQQRLMLQADRLRQQQAQWGIENAQADRSFEWGRQKQFHEDVNKNVLPRFGGQLPPDMAEFADAFPGSKYHDADAAKFNVEKTRSVAATISPEDLAAYYGEYGDLRKDPRLSFKSYYGGDRALGVLDPMEKAKLDAVRSGTPEERKNWALGINRNTQDELSMLRTIVGIKTSLQNQQTKAGEPKRQAISDLERADELMLKNHFDYLEGLDPMLKMAPWVQRDIAEKNKMMKEAAPQMIGRAVRRAIRAGEDWTSPEFAQYIGTKFTGILEPEEVAAILKNVPVPAEFSYTTPQGPPTLTNPPDAGTSSVNDSVNKDLETIRDLDLTGVDLSNPEQASLELMQQWRNEAARKATQIPNR